MTETHLTTKKELSKIYSRNVKLKITTFTSPKNSCL